MKDNTPNKVIFGSLFLQLTLVVVTISPSLHGQIDTQSRGIGLSFNHEGISQWIRKEIL